MSIIILKFFEQFTQINGIHILHDFAIINQYSLVLPGKYIYHLNMEPNQTFRIYESEV